MYSYWVITEHNLFLYFYLFQVNLIHPPVDGYGFSSLTLSMFLMGDTVMDALRKHKTKETPKCNPKPTDT